MVSGLIPGNLRRTGIGVQREALSKGLSHYLSWWSVFTKKREKPAEKIALLSGRKDAGPRSILKRLGDAGN